MMVQMIISNNSQHQKRVFHYGVLSGKWISLYGVFIKWMMELSARTLIMCEMCTFKKKIENLCVQRNATLHAHSCCCHSGNVFKSFVWKFPSWSHQTTKTCFHRFESLPNRCGVFEQGLVGAIWDIICLLKCLQPSSIPNILY